MDFNEIEKAYAMGRAYAQGLKYAKLMAKLNGMAEDDAYETGYATLTDNEGHRYVAHLDEGEEGKKGEKSKKEPEENLTEAELSDFDKLKENRRKENPLSEKMKTAVADINRKVTDKLKEYYREGERLLKDYKKKHKDVLDKYNRLKDLSVSELKNLYRDIVDLTKVGVEFNQKVNKFKEDSFNEFLNTVQAKSKNSKNTGRIGHYLSNIKEKSPLGKLAFRNYEYIPEGVRHPSGFDISSSVGHQLDKKRREMSSDSLEYKELIDFMIEYGIA